MSCFQNIVQLFLANSRHSRSLEEHISASGPTVSREEKTVSQSAREREKTMLLPPQGAASSRPCEPLICPRRSL